MSLRRSNLSAIGDCFVPRSDISFEVLEKTFFDNYFDNVTLRLKPKFQTTKERRSTKENLVFRLFAPFVNFVVNILKCDIVELQKNRRVILDKRG